MLLNTQNRKDNLYFRAISLMVAVCFFMTIVVPSQALAQGVVGLPVPGATVSLSPAFTPTLVRGIRVYPDNPFQFDFIVDSGDTGFQGDELKKESEKLIRYFLASLTLPENDLWVNLSPYEKDRIVPTELGLTEMGVDMLAQDYLLKQITASLTNPDSDLGKEFWSKIYKKAYEQYGTTDIPVDTFNKVWIMPDKAEVYVKDDRAFVVESKLKVMLEEDYVALQAKQRGLKTQDTSHSESLNTKYDIPDTDNKFSLDIIREIIIPALEKEVNVGRNFAQLRQIYNAIILSYWYKTNLKDSILNKVYSDQKKVKGIDLSDKDATEKIYTQYLNTFKKGVCDMIKVEYDPYIKANVPRKYFAGGVTVMNLGGIFNSTAEPSRLVYGYVGSQKKDPTAYIVSFKVESLKYVQDVIEIPRDLAMIGIDAPSQSSSSISDQEIFTLWDKLQDQYVFYHGISINDAESVRKNGLNSDCKPFDKGERSLDEFFHLYGKAYGAGDDGGLKRLKEKGVYITAQYDYAQEFAEKGPEIFSEILKRIPALSEKLDASDREILFEIQNAYAPYVKAHNAYLKTHSPYILRIKGSVLRNSIEPVFARTMFQNQESFLNKVREMEKYYTENKNIFDPELDIQGFEKRLLLHLREVKLSEVSPEDIKFPDENVDNVNISKSVVKLNKKDAANNLHTLLDLKESDWDNARILKSNELVRTMKDIKKYESKKDWGNYVNNCKLMRDRFLECLKNKAYTDSHKLAEEFRAMHSLLILGYDRFNTPEPENPETKTYRPLEFEDVTEVPYNRLKLRAGRFYDNDSNGAIRIIAPLLQSIVENKYTEREKILDDIFEFYLKIRTTAVSRMFEAGNNSLQMNMVNGLLRLHRLEGISHEGMDILFLHRYLNITKSDFVNRVALANPGKVSPVYIYNLVKAIQASKELDRDNEPFLRLNYTPLLDKEQYSRLKSKEENLLKEYSDRPEERGRLFAAYAAKILNKVIGEVEKTPRDKDVSTGSSVISSGKNKSSSASLSDIGGIDFNVQNMNVESKGSSSIQFNLPEGMTTEGLQNIQGLVPVIITITPVTNFMGLLGLEDEEGEEFEAIKGKSVNNELSLSNYERGLPCLAENLGSSICFPSILNAKFFC